MPEKPWRFDPGQTAYVRPCTLDRKVKVIQQVMKTAPNGGQFPHWRVRDEAGKYWLISQIELSSRPATVERGRVKLLSAQEAGV